MKMVMEKSLDMKNWQNVLEFCDQSWNKPICPEDYQTCALFDDI